MRRRIGGTAFRRRGPSVGVPMRPGEILFRDEFRQGLDLTSAWSLTEVPGRFRADDGIATTSDRGLHVRAAGINRETGSPPFSKTWGGEDDNVKRLAATPRVSPNGVPGFDAVDGEEISFSMWVRGRTFGTDSHPFGDAVADPDSDLRLASFAMNVIDYETGMTFDIW